MAEVTVTYKNTDIVELSASGTKVLETGGTYCEDDITVTYVRPSASPGSATTPATTITANPSISVNSSTGLITATASASQSVTPTVVPGYVDSGTAGTITVSGSNTEQLSTQAAATITPTESSQTAVAAGKYTTGAVTVGAISSSYVGSGITRRDSSDMTVADGYATAPAGYYAQDASIAASAGTAWVSLWDGTWTVNSSITVDGFTGYRLFKIVTAYLANNQNQVQNCSILAVRSGSSLQYLRGIGGYATGSSTRKNYYLNASCSGNVLTLDDCCYYDSSESLYVQLRVVEIIGII